MNLIKYQSLKYDPHCEPKIYEKNFIKHKVIAIEIYLFMILFRILTYFRKSE